MQTAFRPGIWGMAGKAGAPSPYHTVLGEPGAKTFIDNLLLGRGFIPSRAAPSLRSSKSQSSTKGFETKKKKERKINR